MMRILGNPAVSSAKYVGVDGTWRERNLHLRRYAYVGSKGAPTPLNMDKRELRLDEYPLLIDGVCLSLSRTQSFGHVPNNSSLRVPSLCECKCGRCRAAA